MTPEERRKTPEHHVVQDYASLVSSGLLRREVRCTATQIPTANSHTRSTNCRKMYEFFVYDPHPRYLRAQMGPAIHFDGLSPSR